MLCDKYKLFISFNKKQKSNILNISFTRFYYRSSSVNHVENASKIIKPIIFSDDTNLFYSHKDLKLLSKIQR